MLKKGMFPFLYGFLLLLWAVAPAHSQETDEAPDSYGSAEIAMGYVRNNGGLVGAGANGFAFTLAAAGNVRAAERFYPGVRVELVGVDAFGNVPNLPGADLMVVSLTAAFESAFGAPTDGIVPYLFAGGGFEKWSLSVFGVTVAETNGGVLELGGGVRFYAGENIYIAPGVTWMHDSTEEEADNVRVMLGLGVSLY